jgi:hypothetical protein
MASPGRPDAPFSGPLFRTLEEALAILRAQGEDAVRRAVLLSVGSLEVPVVSAEDLLLLKLLADRVLDRVDAEDIAREQSGRLDLDYLTRTAAGLGLADRLAELLDRTR